MLVRDSDVLALIGRLAESYDPGLSEHQARTRANVRELAYHMGLGDSGQYVAMTAAVLHDIGKVVVPYGLTSQPRLLTPEEMTLVKRHSEAGYRIVSAVKDWDEVALAVRHHHERFDGRGYPEGLAGDSIPIAARLICAVDAFRAMSNHRPYAPHLTNVEAFKELERCAGTQFDPEVVRMIGIVSDGGRLW